MANQKQVLDVQVSKGITTAQSNEHLRDRSEKAEKYAMSKGNYDPTRKRLNFEIAPGGKIHPIDTSRSIPKRMADILSHRGIKDPNEGLLEPKYRTVVNIILRPAFNVSLPFDACIVRTFFKVHLLRTESKFLHSLP